MEYACAITNQPMRQCLVTFPSGTGKAGDVLYANDTYFLHLGTSVTQVELPGALPHVSAGELLEKQLLSWSTMHFLHDFVAYRFTTYAKALALWLGDDLHALLARKPNSRPKVTIHQQALISLLPDFSVVLEPTEMTQQLVVFPDVWTMMNILPESVRTMPGAVLLHGQSTPKQRQEAFRSIKTGKATHIFTTWSTIFQDLAHCSHCLVVAPHTWYYKQQQDPRYHTVTTLEARCRHLDCSIVMTDVLALHATP